MLDKRILLVDENPAIHEDFRKAFSPQYNNNTLKEVEATLFPHHMRPGDENEPLPCYFIDSAYDGDQALKWVQQAAINQFSYTVAFIDLYFTSGGDGLATIQRIWEVDPYLQFVICMAYSSYSWQKIAKTLQRLDHFLILNKPFNVNEIRQLAFYLSKKRETENDTLKYTQALEKKIIYQSMPKNVGNLSNQEYRDYLSRREELLASLNQALDGKQFVLHYQPLVKSDSGKILGVEAFIRWQHPHLGLLYPQEFLPLAGETDLILSIDEWILKTACAKVKKWQDSIYPKLNITVNISDYHICQMHFVELVKGILKKTGLHPCFLELDFFASQPLRENSEVLKTMLKLKEMGVRFSIDHFGVGYANLNYLQSLPFDRIKMDKNFIRHIQLNKKENAVVESIVSLAKKLGMDIVTEGVETVEQVEFLFDHHSEQMQGYYFSPPLSEQACVILLKKQASSEKTGI
ncbi:MAG: hypothetical protein K0S27_1617 [Gammaproteobacteria bacterium]|nr:hypothetical protein [Gammaproteobacteria bacterium]